LHNSRPFQFGRSKCNALHPLRFSINNPAWEGSHV
jgi:hypothetical protein